MRQNRMRRPETYLADSRRVPKDRWGTFHPVLIYFLPQASLAANFIA